MSNKNIRTVIFLGIISIISILSIQLIWIKKNIEFQEQNIQIQNRQDSINSKMFNDKVIIALKKVAIEIQEINNQPGNLYGNVKQISANYFTVELQDTIHPYLLERILTWEFYDHNVHEDFQYGIYDCFTDDIVYSDYLHFDADSSFILDPSSPNQITPKEAQVKLDTDLHYFSVIFPNIAEFKKQEVPNDMSPWYYLFAIILFVFVFFGFSISIILRQKKLSEIKNDFINNMTHELKTPIATIRISSETLMNMSEDVDSEKLMRYSGIIYKENKRLEQQVERVLNVAKLDKKEIKFKMEYFCAHEIIEEAKENFEFNQLEELGGEINLKLDAKKHVIEADQVHFTNIIYNLLDNAIKYCDKTPQITISSKNIKNRIFISIMDNGKGISRENLKYIFDKFYRVHTGNLHDVKGFGLGLYYVKTIIEELGGSINVKSTLGQGSEFIISFPIKQTDER